MSEWKRCTVGDVCEVFDGPHATPPQSNDGPIYLGIPSIRSDGSIDYENSKRISYENYPKWTKRVTPQENDVVFSYEANLESYARIPAGFEGCLGRRMAIMRPDPSAIDARFLYYYTQSPAWKAVIASRTVLGATVNRIPIATFPEFPLRLPSLPAQQRIAGALSAYDKLIEINRRQIKLLEEAAQRLYKEWFVDLRFPSHETTSIVDGLPEEWERGKLGSVVEFRRGKTITQKETVEGGVPVVAGGLEPAYYHNAANTGSPVITVSGSGANAGFCRLYVTKVWASDCSFADANMTEDLIFVYLTIKVLSNGFKQCQRGSAQPHVYPKHVNDLQVLIPNVETLECFRQLVAPFFIQIGVLEQQIVAAREARDRLLPKLMSGEIEV